MPTSSSGSTPVLDFTGERFTPECVREIWYEHWHRYVFALPMARGRRVLDAACGEGYGSALLATTAAQVTGIDIDASSIEHARQRYAGQPRLRYELGSVTAIDLPDASFDLIVSYETIEHLTEQERMLDEFKRLLAPGGVLVVSSPDRENYNAGGVANPFHVRELSREEFTGLLASRFRCRRLYGQQLAFHSLLWAIDPAVAGPAGFARLDTATGAIGEGPPVAPVYYLAVCAHAEADLPELPALSLFADEQASVYSHYNDEIARLIRADHRIIALERELSELRAQLAKADQTPDTQ